MYKGVGVRFAGGGGGVEPPELPLNINFLNVMYRFPLVFSSS